MKAISGSLGDRAGASAAVPADSWLQVLEQDWAGSAFGQQVDSLLSTWFNHVEPAADPTAMSGNLLVNPSFETADPSESREYLSAVGKLILYTRDPATRSGLRGHSRKSSRGRRYSRCILAARSDSALPGRHPGRRTRLQEVE